MLRTIAFWFLVIELAFSAIHIAWRGLTNQTRTYTPVSGFFGFLECAGMLAAFLYLVGGDI